MNKVENVNISKLRKKRDAKIKLFSYDKRYYMDKDGMLYHIKNDKLVCQSFHRREKRIFVRLVTNSGNIKLFNFAFFIATLLLPNPLQSTRITFKDNNPLNCKLNNLRWEHTIKKVIKCNENGITTTSVIKIAEIYGVTRQYVYNELKKPNGKFSWVKIK